MKVTMTLKYIAYVVVIISISRVQTDTIKVYPSELSIFNKQLIKRDVDSIKDIIPSTFFNSRRHKRDVLSTQDDAGKTQDVPPSEEYETDSQDVLPLPEDKINSRISLIASPLSLFDSLLNLVKNMFLAATDPIISAARDFVLGFFDAIITGLVAFTTKSEPPALFSSIVAHTLNSFIKRGVDFLVYLRETVRYFFNMFISSSNKKSVRAINDPPSDSPVLRNLLVYLLNTIVGNVNTITGGGFHSQLAMLQEFVTNWIDNILGYSQLREVRSLDNHSSSNTALINVLNFAIGNFNTLTRGIFLQESAMLQELLTNLVNQIFPTS